MELSGNIIFSAPVLGIAALVFAFLLASKINKEQEGTERMQEIALAIREGANAFLKAEYKIFLYSYYFY